MRFFSVFHVQVKERLNGNYTYTYVIILLHEDVPCSLQHHDCVLSLVRAGRSELDVNVWQGTAARVAVATT